MYIRPRILLEPGTHAELIPSDRYTITPFAAEQFPRLFKAPSAPVRAIKAELEKLEARINRTVGG